MTFSDLWQRLNDYKYEIRRRGDHLRNAVSGSILHNQVRAYWYEEVVNFGDLITPQLLKRFGLSPIHTPKQDASFLGIGSILQDLRPDFSGVIAGSGLIHDKKVNFPKATMLALRGMLTAERLGAPAGIVLGDPGLLVQKLGLSRQKKKYRIGLVPHFVDKREDHLLELQKRFPEEIVLIDVQQYPEKVTRKIDQCEYILSSSLHGIITADALGIPNGWFRCSEDKIGIFKFHDYASAINRKITPQRFCGKETIDDLIQFTQPVPQEVEQVKINLEQVYFSLRNFLIS